MLIYGINAVTEALRAGHVVSLSVLDSQTSRLSQIVKLANKHGLSPERLSKEELSRAAGVHSHQGVIAQISRLQEVEVRDLIGKGISAPLLLVLDGVEDPQNFGAILRTADAAGVQGVIHQKRRSSYIGAATVKASAGALAHVPIASVVNVARSLQELKDLGVWTVGLSDDGAQRYDAIDLTLPTAIVMGAEGRGLRRLVRECCDWLVSIPMAGKLTSLNVSVATGIALFEAVRQRRNADSLVIKGKKGKMKRTKN